MTNWAIHRVSLATHDLNAAEVFFGSHIGLGQATAVGDRAIAFGSGSRGFRVERPTRTPERNGIDPRHLALEVDDLNGVVSNLDKAAVRYVEAPSGDFDTPAVYTVDPALNVVAFCAAPDGLGDGDGVQPWEADWGWGLHHVNLPAADVREAVGFYTEVAGLAEGQWNAPEAMGDLSIDPEQLSSMALDDYNRGLHINRPDAAFALRNGFAHNPTVGGHPAFIVPDVQAVKTRLEDQDICVSEAGIYAMARIHQIYVYDPSANMIEANQFV